MKFFSTTSLQNQSKGRSQRVRVLINWLSDFYYQKTIVEFKSTAHIARTAVNLANVVSGCGIP